MNIKEKMLASKIISKIMINFHYKTNTDPMLSIRYVYVRQIPCNSSKGICKMAYPRNIIQDNYNKD